MNDASQVRPVQLHVIHDLGGGSSKWLADYVEADTERTNLILRSFAHDTAAGTGISLHASAAADAPALRLWTWKRKIAGAAATHDEYRAVFAEILREHSVDGVLVSSFIGHSLDALDTGLPTLVVNHDYFPYCPAINLYFNAVCKSCDGKRVAECDAGNPHFNAFAGFAPEERVAVRERFVELVQRPNVTMVTPSCSVADNLRALDARFDAVRFVTIPHGYGNPPQRQPAPEPEPGRLRILVLGQLSVAKGVVLLREALGRVTAFADVYLVGTKELGEEFRGKPHIHVVADYDTKQLPEHIAFIRPHFGLLASIVPETFSYALSELMMLGVPVAATRLGSFVERIRHGQDGWLYEPTADALVQLVAHIDSHRGELARVRGAVAQWKARTAREMVDDYHRILPLATQGGGAQRQAAPAPASAEFAAQALTVASMWKEVKALHRQVDLLADARERLYQEINRRELERQALARRIAAANRQWVELDAAIAARDVQLKQLREHADRRDAEVSQILSSTSWKVSAPIRLAGELARDLKTLARCLWFFVRQPSQMGSNWRKVTGAWKQGGVPGLKSALRSLQPVAKAMDAWDVYQETYRRDVRPRIVERLAAMPRRPRISVLVPTYNTPPDVLEAMLLSVETQLYGEWELCVADDASSQPHVSKILAEHAQRDPRIKVDFASENRGVSHASNRALAMATGEFTVLLDHDDQLEEQALFRVAESVLEDDPDLVYSDEVHVSRDGGLAQRFVYRPAFSLEYLRGHQYFIHLVGFRTALLRAIKGFDESLRISQDYDLILRAVEKAQRVVHIPEILYRWRIHGDSVGHSRMSEVTEASTGILRRHLERCDAAASVEPGAIFNVYDVRYRVDDAKVRVAIVIPTKNHGDILRQCIDSIRETVREVRYDIVVVNHDSDEPETLRYLASLDSSVRVLPYSGVFNFSEINNWAVAQLGGSYTHYLFCNNDIEAIEPGWLERMVELIEQPNVGVVGAKLLYPGRNSVQHAGVHVGAFGAAEHFGKFMWTAPDGRLEPGYGCSLIVNHEVSAVTAACLLIRRGVFDAVGGFDSALAVGFGDVDLCLRVLESGHRIVFCAHATLVHHESYTRGTGTIDPHPQDTAEFRRRWARFLARGDPFYNPGLSSNSTGWDVMQPLHCTFDIQRRVYSRDGRASSADPAANTPYASERVKVGA